MAHHALAVFQRLYAVEAEAQALPADARLALRQEQSVPILSEFKAWLDGMLALEYTFGSEPGPGRGGAPPNPDLFPANNPVLKPPIAGRIGLWSKTDSTSYFKDYAVTRK